jgi:hypothetical protein
MSDNILIGLVVGFICYSWGYYEAHITIAKECDKLGAFYVGNTVYECKRKE